MYWSGFSEHVSEKKIKRFDKNWFLKSNKWKKMIIVSAQELFTYTAMLVWNIYLNVLSYCWMCKYVCACLHIEHPLAYKLIAEKMSFLENMKVTYFLQSAKGNFIHVNVPLKPTYSWNDFTWNSNEVFNSYSREFSKQILFK